MSLFDALFTKRQVKDYDLNQVQDRVVTAFRGLSTAFAQSITSAFQTTPSGAATVTMTNAPTGVPAHPVRYVQIPDGRGGFYTFPSLT